MANDFVDVSGAAYVFGFKAADAPSIEGFTARNVATNDMEPEVFVTATNGEGHVEAIAISKPANKMINATFTGYISDSFNPATVVGNFTFLTRKFFIKKISAPRTKGAFVEVSIDAQSFPLIVA